MRLKAILLAVAMAATSLGASAPPARASNLDNGVCALVVLVRFSSSDRLKSIASNINGSPSYTLTVGGEDLDPVTAGAQDCIYPEGGVLNSTPSTTVTAYPSTSGDTMTCEAVLGFGTWNQGWSGSSPADRTGLGYEISGTWGNWVLVIEDNALPPAIVATVYLTPNPTDNLQASTCTGSGIVTMTMLGIEVFQDPEI